MERKINIALVGCGKVSKKHFKSLYFLKEFYSIKAICDLKKNILKESSEFLSDLFSESIEEIKDLKLFNNYSHLLKEIKLKTIQIDLIVICTPSGIHPEQCIMAGELGINVCSEKPLATNHNDAVKLCNFFKKNKAKLFIILQHRVNPYIKLLKKQIDKGRFGKISLITSNVFWHRPQSYYDEAEWRGTKLLDGGALLNQASHYIDLMAYLPNNKIQKISSLASNVDRNIETEDTGVLILEYEKGILGSLSLSILTYPNNLEGSISILGTRGSVKIGGKALNKIENWEFSDHDEVDDLINDANYKIDSLDNLGHFYFYDELKEIINNDIHNNFSEIQGMLSLELVMGAHESISKNKFVKFPL